jgi:hypothetical protein
MKFWALIIEEKGLKGAAPTAAPRRPAAAATVLLAALLVLGSGPTGEWHFNTGALRACCTPLLGPRNLQQSVGFLRVLRPPNATGAPPQDPQRPPHRGRRSADATT